MALIVAHTHHLAQYQKFSLWSAGPGLSNADMPHGSMSIPELVTLLVRLPI